MSLTAHIVIPGEPRGQGRPRAVAFREGNRVSARLYPHNDDVKWRERAQFWILDGLVKSGVEELAFVGPVAVRIVAFFELPKSHHRVREPRERQWKLGKPDGDNVEKAVLDSLTGVAFADDSQVVTCSWTRILAAQGEEPRIEIEITSIDVGADGKPLPVEKSLFEAAPAIPRDT